MTGDWRIAMGGSRSLLLRGGLNFTKNEITRVDPLPAVLANSAETGLLDVVTRVAIEEERPEWRGTLTGEYSAGGFHALGAARLRRVRFAQRATAHCRETRWEAPFDLRWVKFSSMIVVGARTSSTTIGPPQMSQQHVGIFPWAAARLRLHGRACTSGSRSRHAVASGSTARSRRSRARPSLLP